MNSTVIKKNRAKTSEIGLPPLSVGDELFLSTQTVNALVNANAEMPTNPPTNK